MALPDPNETPTLGADEMSELLGVSTWSVYQHPDAVVPPIRVGRKLRWPTARVLEGLGYGGASKGTAGQ